MTPTMAAAPAIAVACALEGGAKAAGAEGSIADALASMSAAWHNSFIFAKSTLLSRDEPWKGQPAHKGMGSTMKLALD